MRLLSSFLLILLTGCNGVFFYPNKIEPITPSEIGLPYEEVFLSGPPKLHAWWIPATVPPKASILFLHGNAQNISSHLPSVFWLPPQGFNVLTLDYRGYGQSEGVPTTSGLVADAKSALQWIDDRTPELPLIIYGQSLGASIGLSTGYDLSPFSRVKLIVAESPFGSYRQIAREKLANVWLTWPFQWLAWLLISDDNSPSNYASQWSGTPVLTIVSESDQIVPAHHGKELCQALKSHCTIWVFNGIPHIQIFADQKNRIALVEKMTAALSR